MAGPASIRRRVFVAGGIAALASSGVAWAQPAGRVIRIGTLTRGGREAAAPYNRALAEGLAALGWVEGRNVRFEHRYADLKAERYPDLAADLVRLGVDLVVAPSTPAALAVRRVTATIPIVVTVANDPLGAGLVASLARPGGNVTGLTVDTGPDSLAKLLQLLKEVVPQLTRAAVLRESSIRPGYAEYASALEAASRSLDVTLQWIEVRGPDHLESALATVLRERAPAVVVAMPAMSITHAKVIAAFAARHRLASIARPREFAEAGGLMAYSTDIRDLYRRAAIHIDKILRGASPAELPIEQPTRFELAVNVKTAKAIGLAIPRSMLLRADTVIE
jgi:putative ABC transport system substrate-binding protein